MKPRVSLVALATTLAVLAPRGAPADGTTSGRDAWLGADKALHFGASAALASGAYAVSAAAGADDATRVGVSVALAFGAGVTKELWDLAGYGEPSWRDLTWDAVGAATGVALSLLVDRLLLSGTDQRRRESACAVPDAAHLR